MWNLTIGFSFCSSDTLSTISFPCLSGVAKGVLLGSSLEYELWRQLPWSKLFLTDCCFRFRLYVRNTLLPNIYTSSNNSGTSGITIFQALKLIEQINWSQSAFNSATQILETNILWSRGYFRVQSDSIINRKVQRRKRKWLSGRFFLKWPYVEFIVKQCFLISRHLLKVFASNYSGNHSESVQTSSNALEDKLYRCLCKWK